MRVEGHGFGVHEEELGIEPDFGGGLGGHFDLHGGDGDADGGGLELTGEIEAAGAHAATDIENVGAALDACKGGEMLDQLDLCSFFGFVAGDPIAVVKMLAPEGKVVGTDDIIMFDDFQLVVGTREDMHEPSIY